MSTITIVDLSPSGLGLFLDSESYMEELSDGDITVVSGGSPATPVISLVATGVAVGTFAASYVWGRYTKR